MSVGTGNFKMTERATCPRCGEKRGVRAGQSRGCQNYKCRGCKRFWRGAAPPPPPDRTCPYCGGHCHKRGSLFLSGRKPGIPSLMDQWCGMRQLRPAERVQCYICAVCGRHNTELWPSEKGRGTRWGLCRFALEIGLDAQSEEALARYCLTHRLRSSEAIRTIFRAVSYAKFATSSRVFGTPPILPPDTPMPPLPDGRRKVAERKRGKAWGYREAFIVRRYKVCLDAVSYLGLKRTMESQGMTRQEAARWLISQ